MKQLIIKDLLLHMKDLKFQVFLIIITSLFIVSSISSAKMYKDSQRIFVSDYATSQAIINQQSENMMNYMRFPNNFLFFDSESLNSILFSSKPYITKMGSPVVMYHPRQAEFSRDRNPVNWIFIITLLGSFIALIFSYDSISKEKKKGTLKLKTVNNVSRLNVVLSKFISIIALLFTSIIIALLLSIVFIYAMLSFIPSGLLAKAIIFVIVSFIYLSFFVLLGIYVSLKKKHLTAIISALFLWLLFIVILPQAIDIISIQLRPLKSIKEYSRNEENAYSTEIVRWVEQHGQENVYGNANLENGIRAQAFYSSSVATSQEYIKRIEDERKQIELVRLLSFMSPNMLFNEVIDIMNNLGYHRTERVLELLKIRQAQIKQVMIEEDKKDVRSLNLFYGNAFGDQGVVLNKGLTPFSTNPFPNKDLLFVNFEPLPWQDRAAKAFYPFAFLLFATVFIFIVNLLKIRNYDIR